MHYKDLKRYAKLHNFLEITKLKLSQKDVAYPRTRWAEDVFRSSRLQSVPNSNFSFYNFRN